MHPHYRDAWAELLSGPIEGVLAILEADTELARDLRQASPFAGVVDNATRWKLWREARGR